MNTANSMLILVNTCQYWSILVNTCIHIYFLFFTFFSLYFCLFFWHFVVYLVGFNNGRGTTILNTCNGGNAITHECVYTGDAAELPVLANGINGASISDVFNII